MQLVLPLFLGHIVGERPAGLLSWLAALAMFGGVLGALLAGREHRSLRLAFAVVGVAGLAGTGFDYYSRSQRPSRPDLVIRLLSPSRTTGIPVVIRVCGYTTKGRSTPVNAGGRWLLIRVDGIQRAEVHQAIVSLVVKPGHHLLRVEVNNQYHQEFQPPLLIEHDFLAEPSTKATSIPHCPKMAPRTP